MQHGHRWRCMSDSYSGTAHAYNTRLAHGNVYARKERWTTGGLTMQSLGCNVNGLNRLLAGLYACKATPSKHGPVRFNFGAFLCGFVSAGCVSWMCSVYYCWFNLSAHLSWISFMKTADMNRGPFYFLSEAKSRINAPIWLNFKFNNIDWMSIVSSLIPCIHCPRFPRLQNVDRAGPCTAHDRNQDYITSTLC